MIRHPWWLRKQSVCVIICPCRLLCILSDSSLLKQANSVEDCQACCGEIIILVVIYNKLSSASSTFFSRKKSQGQCIFFAAQRRFMRKCAGNIWSIVHLHTKKHFGWTFLRHVLKTVPTPPEKAQNYQPLQSTTCSENYMGRQNRVPILYFFKNLLICLHP